MAGNNGNDESGQEQEAVETSDQSEQIADLLEGYQANEEESSEPIEEPEGEESVEEPEAEEEVLSEESEPEPEPEPEPTGESETISELKDEIRQLREMIAQQGQEEPVDEAEPQETEVEVPEGLQNFVSEEEFEEAQTSPEAFNAMLARFYQQVMQESLRNIPRVVEKTTSRRVAYETAISNFWENNADLKDYVEYVKYTANKVQSENPNMGLVDALNETANRVRTELNLQEKAKDREKKRQTDAPSFNRKPRGPRGGDNPPNLSEQQKQINELIGG